MNGSYFLIFSIQIVAFVAIILDFPLVRQVFGFLYLTFIPGFLLLKIFKLRRLDNWERILFSLGLSIAFLMLTGLFINELFPLLGVSKPLSLMPILIVLSGVTLSLFFLCYSKEKGGKNNLKDSKVLFYALFLISIPILSISGAMLMNILQSNILLLLMIVLISIVVILVTLFKKPWIKQMYPIVLLAISIALLFHSSLISNFIYGHDIGREFYLFKLTKNDLHWNSAVNNYPTAHHHPYDLMNGMLSITILPTIYSEILNIQEIWVFKLVYPLIFSFVPLILYQMYKKRFSEKAAFLAVFYFMAYGVFFSEMLGLVRQMIAELFYALLLFLILDECAEKHTVSRRICLALFSAGLIMSHYALSSLFIFCIILAYVSLYFLKRNSSIPLTFVILFFVMEFGWYIYTSKSGAFNELILTIESIYKSTITDFFNPQARGREVLRGLGLETPPSTLHLISRIFAYITQFFIVVGSYYLLKSKKKKFEDYTVFISLNMVLLIMCIILPNFAAQLNMSRLYHILLFLLAPLCIVGGQAVLRFILNSLRGHRKKKIYALNLVLIILIPYFLFQTEFLYEITGQDSWSLPLSKYRIGLRAYTSFKVVDEQDVYGAEWLSKNIMGSERKLIYGDESSGTILTCTLLGHKIEFLRNSTEVQPSSFIYLRRVNLIYEIIGVWNITNFSTILSDMNVIYSNGGCSIYK